jgi:hypothetical protein
MAGIDDRCPRLALHLQQVIFPGSFGRLDLPFDAGPIRFPHQPIFELFGDSSGRAYVPGEHQRSRHGPIDAVGHAQVNVAGLLLAGFDPISNAQLHAIDARRRLREQTDRLEHDIDRPGLVQQFERRRFHGGRL